MSSLLFPALVSITVLIIIAVAIIVFNAYYQQKRVTEDYRKTMNKITIFCLVIIIVMITIVLYIFLIAG